jgi:hypothetical protein
VHSQLEPFPQLFVSFLNNDPCVGRDLNTVRIVHSHQESLDQHKQHSQYWCKLKYKRNGRVSQKLSILPYKNVIISCWQISYTNQRITILDEYNVSISGIFFWLNSLKCLSYRGKLLSITSIRALYEVNIL